MASLTNWVWLVGKSDLKMMVPRNYSCSHCNLVTEMLFVWESSVPLNEKSPQKASVAWGLQNLLLPSGALQGEWGQRAVWYFSWKATFKTHEDLHLNQHLLLLCFQLGHMDGKIILQLLSEINCLGINYCHLFPIIYRSEIVMKGLEDYPCWVHLSDLRICLYSASRSMQLLCSCAFFPKL